MKNIKNIIKAFGLATFVGVTVTSCDLDLLPLNEVVLENYWTNRDDVDNVLRSCYTGMESAAWMERAIVWGEVRSDNVSTGSTANTTINYINKGNLKQTNAYCDWSSFYNVINRCNTVIYYAPQVAEKDPNFTSSDLAVTIAEAKTIRALNYFYLIRAFKNVPFTFSPSIDDTQNYRLPASSFENILDSLILDLEGCKDNAPRAYFERTKNSGRVTRAAIYALLADLYLWRASDANRAKSLQEEDYRKCVQCCDWVLNYKYEEYMTDKYGDLNRAMDSYVLTNYGYPLLAEKSASGGSSNAPQAYNSIFVTGNSFESLYELTYSESVNDIHNTAVGYMYGSNNDVNQHIQWLSANENLMETVIPNSAKTYSETTLFPVTTDYRSLTSFRYVNSGSFAILKYVTTRFQGDAADFGVSTATSWAAGTAAANNQKRSPYSYAINWIFYRLSEVMLMRAEAEINLANLLGGSATPAEPESNGAKARRIRQDGAMLSTATELYDDAFNLILAVYMRSNPNAQSGKDTEYRPVRTNYNLYEDFVTLLENERQREFLFEGKRYFDLVRRARREGNTSHFAAAVASKYGEASRSVVIKMAMMDFMYMPYAEHELDVNPSLSQNPAYAEDEDIVKN